MTQIIKTITIGHTTLELPAGMPSKDIQQLAGYLATLRRVEGQGLWAEDYRTISYVETNGPAITLGEMVVHTKQEAEELAAADKLARDAKEKATT
tara:strand:- start:263 stop:547 length:285 start_codon:yes stop_codon:yes gene_type:complete